MPILSDESILLKCLIKAVGKPVNRFSNEFERFVQFPAVHADSSEAVLTQSFNRKFKIIKSVERSGARPVPGGMPLPRLN